MKGWGTDESSLVRLLAGLDGPLLASVLKAYEAKYQKPLPSALRKEVSGNFRRAATCWVRALQDPSRGLAVTARYCPLLPVTARDCVFRQVRALQDPSRGLEAVTEQDHTWCTPTPCTFPSVHC